MTIECLEEWVPYNELIGDPDCTDTHLVKVVEEWKDVPGYEGYYMASSFGRVLSIGYIRTDSRNQLRVKKDKILAASSCNRGYYSITLSKNNIQKQRPVHRLVAEIFIDNPDNKPEVNHKKGIKGVNKVWLLEWSTSLENTEHAFKTGLRVTPTNLTAKSGKDNPHAKKVYCYKPTGEFYREFETATAASLVFCVSVSLISMICTGKKTHKHGYKFYYNKI